MTFTDFPQGLSRLGTLELNFCQLHSVETMAFRGLRGLEFLRMAHNLLTRIPAAALTDHLPPQLYGVNLEVRIRDRFAERLPRLVGWSLHRTLSRLVCRFLARWFARMRPCFGGSPCQQIFTACDTTGIDGIRGAALSRMECRCSSRYSNDRPTKQFGFVLSVAGESVGLRLRNASRSPVDDRQ